MLSISNKLTSFYTIALIFVFLAHLLSITILAIIFLMDIIFSWF